MNKKVRILSTIFAVFVVMMVSAFASSTFSLNELSVIGNSDEYLTINSKYSIDLEKKIIYMVPQNTIARDIVNSSETNVEYSIIDDNDAVLNDDDIIVTGNKLKISFSTGDDFYDLAILGDLNGFGKTTKEDLYFLSSVIINKDDILSNLQFYASDVTGDKSLKMNDVVMLSQNVSEDNTKFVITYVDNGATVSRQKDICDVSSISSCEIMLPDIKRNDYEIIGFSKSRNATIADYLAGSKAFFNNGEVLYAITRKKVNISFDSNGSDGISFLSTSCYMYNSYDNCSVKTPTINISNDESIIGWNISSDSRDSLFDEGKIALVNSSATYYAITSKKYMLSFDKNNSTKLSDTDAISCISYNGKSCTVSVLLPVIYNVGYNIIGYSFNLDSSNKENDEYVVGNNVNIELNSNKTLYAITSLLDDKLEFNSLSDIGGYSIDIQKNLNNSDEVVNLINRVYSKADWLLINGKIFILGNESNFTSNYDNLKYATIYLKEDCEYYDVTNSLAIAWKNYYKSITSNDLLSDSVFKEIYDIYKDRQGGTKSKEDYFASLFSYYYWSEIDNSDVLYNLDRISELENSKKDQLKEFFDEKVSITKNDFKL